jgi:hypothetical protein
MELRRSGRLAIGDLLRGLQRTLVFELGGHASHVESVIADPGLMPASAALRTTARRAG